MDDQKENTKQLLINWLNVEVLANENQKLKTLLYDETTELPTLSYYTDKIETLLDDFEQVGLLYVDVAKKADVEKIFGWRILDEILIYVAKSLTDLQKKTIRENDEIAVVTKNGNAFIVLLAPSRKNTATTLENLLSIKKRISEEFDVNLKKRAPALYEKFKCSIGCSFIKKIPDVKTERLIFNSIEEARENIFQTKTKEPMTDPL